MSETFLLQEEGRMVSRPSDRPKQELLVVGRGPVGRLVHDIDEPWIAFDAPDVLVQAKAFRTAAEAGNAPRDGLPEGDRVLDADVRVAVERLHEPRVVMSTAAEHVGVLAEDRPCRDGLPAPIVGATDHAGAAFTRVVTLLIGVRGELRKGAEPEAAIRPEGLDILGFEVPKHSRCEHGPRCGELNGQQASPRLRSHARRQPLHEIRA